MASYRRGLIRCEVFCIIVEKEIEVTIGSRNKKHFESLGYYIPKYEDCHHNCMSIKKGTKITVLVNDLPRGSHIVVHYICDHCGKKGSITYQNYLKTEHNGSKYCPKCTAKLITKQVWLDKYGVDHPLKNSEVLQKTKNTIIDRYGVENVFSSEIIKEKIKQTNLDKLGVEYPMQSNIVQEKSKQTCDEKYGVQYTLQSKEVRQKGMETLTSNNKVPTSKQQEILYNMLLNEYGDKNVWINYPLSEIALDIRLIIQDTMFDIEYDCYYWHKNKQNHDRKRDEFTKSQGYKILRIKSGHLIPDIEQINSKIFFMIKNNYGYSEIIMEDWG